ncbi:MAG: hypothetical protein CMO01_25695 [Thalassobius sp.]|nr:hypothetical protein [Thalassovita sp.]
MTRLNTILSQIVCFILLQNFCFGIDNFNTYNKVNNSIIVNARGSKVNGVFAHFNLYVNDTYAGDAYVTDTWNNYTFSNTITCENIHTIKVKFDNDALVNTEDRNLYVASVYLCNKFINTTSDSVNYYRKDGLLIADKGVMPWNGEMIFSNYPNGIVQADYKADRLLTYTDVPIQFTDISTGNIVNWLWDFGDGNTSTQQNPVHQYASSGNYKVKLSINYGADIMSRAASFYEEEYIIIAKNKSLPYTLEDGGNFESNFDDFLTEPSDVNGIDYNNSYGHFEVVEFPEFSDEVTSGTHAAKLVKYADAAHARLHSPNFNFNVPQKYQLSFYMKNEINFFIGFKMEYSLNKGLSWEKLGHYYAPDWYNSNQYPSLWDYFIPKVYTFVEDTTYKQYNIDLSFLQGESNVTFRINYILMASSNETGNGPIWIDDFSITEINEPLRQVHLNLKGSNAESESAHFNVYLNEDKIADMYSQYIYDYANYKITIPNTYSQVDSITIEFDNDRLTSTEDRNLYVKYIILDGDSIAITDSRVKLDKFEHDGINVIPGQIVMPWRSFLVFDLTSSANQRESAELVNNEELQHSFGVFPNPVENSLQISLPALPEQPASLTVYTSEGKQVYTSQFVIPSANYSYNIDFEDFTSGMYHVNLQIGEHIYYSKILKK